MFESFYQTTDAERAILRKLRVWIAGLAIVCALAGIGIGALLSEHQAVAQNELKNAPAPELLSASFSDIVRRVEPAVVNIDTLQAPSEIATSDNEDKDDQSANNPLLD